MANTIKIKRGSGEPSTLEYGELGFDTYNGFLYIGDENKDVIPVKVEEAFEATHAIGASLAENAKNATTASTCTGNATTATKLATARTIRTNLSSTSAVSFNGTANIMPGVIGILPTSRGGTGTSSISAFVLTYIYPIGSIYTSVNSTSPAELFGGTWERLTGRFLLGTDSGLTDDNGDEITATYEAGATGGETTHTLTTSEIPSHHHGSYYTGNTSETLRYPWLSGSGTGSNMGYGPVYAGGGKAHNNMPPYVSVYMWKRIEDEAS